MLINLEKQFLKISLVMSFPNFLKSMIISIFFLGDNPSFVFFLNKSYVTLVIFPTLSLVESYIFSTNH